MQTKNAKTADLLTVKHAIPKWLKNGGLKIKVVTGKPLTNGDVVTQKKSPDQRKELKENKARWWLG
jgi:hypothetical protein